MATKLSTAVRNARLDAIEVAVGASPVLRIRTGAPPATVADPDSGTALTLIPLPADWLDPASGGVKGMAAPVGPSAAVATGTAGHFRLYASDGVTPHIQGTVTMAGGGGDMIVDNTSIATGQPVTITAFTLTDGNA